MTVTQFRTLVTTNWLRNEIFALASSTKRPTLRILDASAKPDPAVDGYKEFYLQWVTSASHGHEIVHTLTCICTCAHAHTHTHTHTHLPTQTSSESPLLLMDMKLFLLWHAYLYMHTRIHTHMHTHMYGHIHTHACMHMYAFMLARVYMHTRVCLLKRKEKSEELETWLKGGSPGLTVILLQWFSNLNITLCNADQDCKIRILVKVIVCVCVCVHACVRVCACVCVFLFFLHISKGTHPRGLVLQYP